MDLGTFGVWWSYSWANEEATTEKVAAELEQLGYSTLWMSGGFTPGIPAHFATLLAATTTATVATGILSVYLNDPAETAAEVARLGDRFLLGIGASHSVLVEASGGTYDRPWSKVAAFLDGLDRAEVPVASSRRVLAALGPRMLALAGARSLGAHPYFVPVEHTARAREVLGAGPVLAPEVAVVLETDPGAARAAARSYTTGYLSLPNYANNLRSLGFGEDDLAGGGSDRLVDAVVPWGSPAEVARRLREHLDAGADHVCIQIVRDQRYDFPLAEYRSLAEALA